MLGEFRGQEIARPVGLYPALIPTGNTALQSAAAIRSTLRSAAIHTDSRHRSHGGPGGGTNPRCAAFTIPSATASFYSISEGAGDRRQMPSSANTTADLISDMELFRRNLALRAGNFSGDRGVRRCRLPTPRPILSV